MLVYQWCKTTSVYHDYLREWRLRVARYTEVNIDKTGSHPQHHESRNLFSFPLGYMFTFKFFLYVLLLDAQVEKYNKSLILG